MSVLLTEPEAVYHSQAGEYLSSHLLDIFRKNPVLYKATVTREYTRPDKEYFAFGRAVHCLVLEGEGIFRERYIANSPVNPSTGKCYGPASKAYLEWAMGMRDLGMEPITAAQEELTKAMVQRLCFHKEIQWLLNASPYREKVIRARYCNMPCQIRMDALGEQGIVDFKTCDTLSKIPFAAKIYNYYGQLAFYREVMRVSKAGFPCDVHLIASEKEYPYRCGIWHITKESLDIAQEDNELYMLELKECQDMDDWPTRYEEVRELKLSE